MTHGVFSYDDLPVTIGPLPGDNTTNWQFLIQDIANPGCFGVDLLGPVFCDTTDFVFEPEKSSPLEIFYGSSGTFFIAPEDITEFSLWTYDGRLLYSDRARNAGERVLLDKHIPVPGLYFVHVRARDRIFVGKVVEFRE
jgi:hypothetical protein